MGAYVDAMMAGANEADTDNIARAIGWWRRNSYTVFLRERPRLALDEAKNQQPILPSTLFMDSDPSAPPAPHWRRGLADRCNSDSN